MHVAFGLAMAHLLDFMCDLVHIDATVVGFLLIVTISTLRKVSPKKTL